MQVAAGTAALTESSDMASKEAAVSGDPAKERLSLPKDEVAKAQAELCITKQQVEPAAVVPVLWSIW